MICDNELKFDKQINKIVRKSFFQIEDDVLAFVFVIALSLVNINHQDW